MVTPTMPALLHTRHGSDGRPIERHAPTPSLAVVLIRAAIRRGRRIN